MWNLSRDIGIDLGTASILVYVKGKGVVLREPSVVAIDKNTSKLLKVGTEAQKMLGRTPGNIVAIRPLREGVISDYDMTERMLKEFIKKVTTFRLFKPRVCICVPSGITEVEERAVIDAGIQAGARRVYLIEEPLAAALGADPLMTGGAILSGVYFGDRCSPVSTSALLVADLTGTDLFGNIRQMLRTCLVPFALAAGLYLLFGLSSPAAGQAADIAPLFALEFRLGPLPLIPAALILVLSALRVRVKAAMLASIAAAAVLCLAYQGAAPLTLLKDAVLGFSAQSPELATMIDGGGIVSMLQVGAIVCLSSSYSGIFQRTGLLEPIRRRIEAWGAVLSPYAAVLVTSVLASAIACNQTLSIMLTHQLCGGLEKSREKLAIYLENSAVVVAPLIPWSIAGGVPLASAGAPAASLLTAFFLFLLPLWQLVTAGRGRRATV